MPHYVQIIIDFIGAHAEWAYVIVGLTAFGESFAFLSLFFPGTTILIAAGTLVGTGVLNPWWLIFAGIVGALVGDAISFWIGRRFGHVVPNVWPFKRRPEMLARGVTFFDKYGSKSVFIGRFFGPVRAVIPLSAGMMRMPIRRFYAASVLSALIWAPALITPGALVGWWASVHDVMRVSGLAPASCEAATAAPINEAGAASTVILPTSTMHADRPATCP
jgi:membrane protein DedA with SNARE-associated domain